MSNCNNINIPSCELNLRLVPTFLQGMSNSQICAFVYACTKKSKTFKNQVLDFVKRMKLSKQYTVERKCYCPTKVIWTVSNAPLVISAMSLCNYYNFTASNNTGFAFILRTVLNCVQKIRYVGRWLEKVRNVVVLRQETSVIN